MEYKKVLSIDCGIKNLAYCIIEFQYYSKKQIEKYKKELDIIEYHFNKIQKTFDNQLIYINFENKLKLLKKKIKRNLDFKIIKWDNINLINDKKVKSVSVFNLSKILVKRLDEINGFLDVNYVLIEQQPSKNSKMKTLQTALYSYFMIRGIIDSNKPIKNIIYVSPKNKLKGTTSQERGVIYEYYNECSGKKDKGTRYRNNKKVGVNFCSYLLSQYNKDNDLTFFESKKGKKDDYADAFLQAYCYYPRI